MENRKRKVRTCRVKCILPTDEVKQILLLHSLSTKRIEDKISVLFGMVDTNREVSDSDADCIIKACDTLERKLDRLTIFCGFITFLFSIISLCNFI